MNKSDCANKKVTLLGLGSYGAGSGIAAAEFLVRCGARLTVTDLKSKRELAPQIAALRTALGPARFKTIRWVLGKHNERDCKTADMVVRNPDVPWYSPYLECARRADVPIKNDITLFFQLHDAANIIGVTGTRGKTTTTHLIYEMVRRAHKRVRIGGNVGVSPLTFMEKLRPADPVVLELSSFLLHDFAGMRVSPHIAVVVNIFPDHLNKYHTMAEYIDDKRRIFRYQKPGDVVVLNWDNAKTRVMAREAAHTGSRVLWFSLTRAVVGAYVKDDWFMFNDGTRRGVKRIARVSDTKLLGAHNRANVCASIAVAAAYGVATRDIVAVIKTFRGVPYRLELVRTVHGVKWYNDSTATSPEAAMAALSAFPKKKIVLITGGNSKGVSYKTLAAAQHTCARVIIKVPGKANRDLALGIDAHNLREAVHIAHREARRGEVVLLSPGLTWLPTINEFARGDQFRALVKKL